MDTGLPKEAPLNLYTLGTITKTLESIVLELFGPNGYQVLLSTATGHVTVTNNSTCIFSALHLSNPVGRFIIKSLINTLNVTSDNGKTFILHLSDMLDGIRREFKIDSRQGHEEENKTDRLAKTRAAQSLQLFLKSVYPCLMLRVQRFLFSVYREEIMSDLSISTNLKGTIRTVLSPHFTPKLTDFFAQVLWDMLSVFSSSVDLFLNLQMIMDNFDLLHCKIPNQPYTLTKLVSSVIIQRDFTVCLDSLRKDQIKFIICKFALSNQGEGHNTAREIMSIKSESEATKFVLHQPEKVKSFLDVCVQKGINLVLSSDKFADYAVHLFREMEVSLIHCMLEEDLEFLQVMTKRHAVSDMTENIDNTFIATAKSCNQIEIGIKRFVHLDIGDHIPKTLLISAPTDGLCSNVVFVCHKVIKYLALSLNDSYQIDTSFQGDITNINASNTEEKDKDTILQETGKHSSDQGEITNFKSSEANKFDSLFISPSKFECELSKLKLKYEINVPVDCGKVRFVPGGGSVEFILAKFLFDLSKDILDCDMKLICKIIGNAMLKIPQILHKNSALCPVSMRAREFLEIQQIIFNKLDAGEILGINHRGQMLDMWKEQVTESLNCKFYIISAVIQTLTQLLRSDSILGVKRISLTSVH